MTKTPPQSGSCLLEFTLEPRLLLLLLAGPLAYGQCPALESIKTDLPVIKVDLATKQIPAKSGSPLWVEVIMTNSLDRDISFLKSTNTNTYPIVVTDETGRDLPDKRPGFRHGRFDPALLDPKRLDSKLVDSGEIVRMLSGSLVCIT